MDPRGHRPNICASQRTQIQDLRPAKDADPRSAPHKGHRSKTLRPTEVIDPSSEPGRGHRSKTCAPQIWRAHPCNNDHWVAAETSGAHPPLSLSSSFTTPRVPSGHYYLSAPVAGRTSRAWPEGRTSRAWPNAITCGNLCAARVGCQTVGSIKTLAQ